MRQSNVTILAWVVAAIYVLLCAMAMGQTTGSATRERPAGHPPTMEDRLRQADRAAGIMRRSGGSLLRASLELEASPNQARIQDVSFIAVPEPEPRTVKKHDLVTIVVREQSEFSSRGKTDVKKQAAIEAQLEQFIRINPKNFKGIEAGGIDEPLTISGDANAMFKGEGIVDRSDSFTARIQAEVVDVKPNGTLVLQARKRIKTDDEEQQFILTGIARAEDITPDNTVLSTQLFDLNLEKMHSGSVRQAGRKGWLPRLLDALNPF